MAWVWTKQFSSLDDGQILTGLQLGTIQTDVTNNAVDLTSSQTITGDKIFSGQVTFSGSVLNIAKVSEYVFWEDELVSWEDEAVIYQ